MGYMKDLDRRIRQGGDDAVAAACELAAFPMERLRLLSANGDFPTPDNAANRDNTPAANDTPSQGIEHDGCTLTDAEREAVERAVGLCDWWAAVKANELAGQDAATLRNLLERMA